MDSMEIDDTHINKSFRMDDPISKVDFQRRTQPSRCRCTSVCLGLLCAVLLAGNIGQISYYEIFNRLMLGDPLQGLKNETDQLQASYNTLKQEHNQLQTSFNNVGRDLEALQTNHNDLTANKNQLQTNYNNLQRSNVKLQTTFSQVQGNYSSLKRDKYQLQASYNTLKQERDLMQTSYSLLWKDKEQLQNSYNIVKSEKEQLQTNYSILATSQEQLQKKLENVRRNTVCQTGWQKFDISCYLVTTLKKNWTSSRQDCIAKGADLVIIDSREEQVFVNGLLKSGRNAWIGLSDSLEEGTWLWLDGTPVTIEYWQPGQPNSFNGNQDCGEIVQKEGGGEWNDDGCFGEQVGICEK